MLKHVQTARIPESYLYGQIHFDELDDGEGQDRFTSSREGVIADDELFESLLQELRKIIQNIIDKWDQLRLDNKEDGDDDNEQHMSRKARASHKLYSETAIEYRSKNGKNSSIVQKWIDTLEDDATFNLQSYTECFISENLVREYVGIKNIAPGEDAEREIERWRKTERVSKEKANLSIQIRSDESDSYYLDMEHLCAMADPQKGPPNHLVNDEQVFTPLRNAVMHTSRLTEEAKKRLTTVYDNIRARVKKLLTES